MLRETVSPAGDEDSVRIGTAVSRGWRVEAETTARPLKIFLNYRRADARFHTERLRDMLAERFGDENVFWDIDSLDLGEDFVKAINDYVGACHVLVAVIGEEWSSITDEAGRRRLDNPEDYVRLEIEAALRRGVRVIPAFVQGAAPPRSTELPETLQPLARRNGIQLRDSDFRRDVEHLIDRLESIEREVAGENGGPPLPQPPVQPPVQPLVQPPVEAPVQPPAQPPVEAPVQPPVQPLVQQTNGKAIAALVCPLVVPFVGPVLGLIFGKQAKREIAASGGAQGGLGLAKWGIIASWILLALYAFWVLFIIIAANSGGSS